MAAALGLAQAQQPIRAADAISHVVDSMHSSRDCVPLAAKGMPVLQQAERHAAVVKVATHAVSILYVLFDSRCCFLYAWSPYLSLTVSLSAA